MRTNHLEEVEACSTGYRLLPLEASRHMYQQPWSAVQCALKSAQIQDHRSETERLMHSQRDWVLPTPHDSGYRVTYVILQFVTFAFSVDVRTTEGNKRYNPCRAYQGIE